MQICIFNQTGVTGVLRALGVACWQGLDHHLLGTMHITGSVPGARMLMEFLLASSSPAG